MKHYVLDIETYNDGTNDAKSVYEYATKDEAVASFHARMGSAMRNAACSGVLCLAISQDGDCHAQEYWQRSE